MFNRLISPIKSNSFFVFGARGTGKSTLLKGLFQNQNKLWIDLLNPQEEDVYSKNPNILSEQIAKKKSEIDWVIIDEVQKVPALLNIVHHQIENSKICFALTGSSARKLKRGSANLLAGRAFVYHLFPLTHLEMGSAFELIQVLQWGSLPKISMLSTKKEKELFLKSYALTYLKEEVWNEHLIHKLNPFRRFLEIAAQTNGEILNYSNVAEDVGVDTKTIQTYFEILSDTLVGFFLEPYHRSIRKQQRQNPKFYFFDLGVERALEGILTQELILGTHGFGRAFEHFIVVEAMRLNEYFQKDYRFYYLRTKDDAEIDLIIERPGLPTVLVEIKSTAQVTERHTKTVERFLKDFKNGIGYCFSLDPKSRKIGNVHVVPWDKGFEEIGLGR
jgi:predicted AAA+ superfamily ATPase